MSEAVAVPARDPCPASIGATWVERYGAEVAAMASRVTRDAADADDVTQNALMKIARKASTFRGEAHPRSWLYRVVLNESRELYRWRRRRPAGTLENIPVLPGDAALATGLRPQCDEPGQRMAREEVRRLVRDAIEDLPAEFREPLVLQDLAGMPYRQAARLMGLNLATFKTRLHRARTKLRRLLAPVCADAFD
ncbi:MAG: RNA polymerase sigma factor [Planctomycetota bacterium]|jgi:RNA polymerase sigma-70 factor (ECF subfamily)